MYVIKGGVSIPSLRERGSLSNRLGSVVLRSEVCTVWTREYILLTTVVVALLMAFFPYRGIHRLECFSGQPVGAGFNCSTRV